MVVGKKRAQRKRAVKKQPQKKKAQCPQCGKWLSDRRARDVHVSMHSKSRRFPCGFAGCPKVFGYRSSVSRCRRKHRNRAMNASHPAYVLDDGASSAAAGAAGPSSTNLEANPPTTHSYEWATNQPIPPPPEPIEIPETFIEPDPYAINFA